MFSNTVIAQLTILNYLEKTLPKIEFELTIPAGISIVHLPLAVASASGEPRTITRGSDLFEVLGGPTNVGWLIITLSSTPTRPSRFQVFLMRLPDDAVFRANSMIQPETGIIAAIKQTVELFLAGNPLEGELHLNPGPNLIGISLYNAGIRRFSDLVRLAAIADNLSLIAMYTDGTFLMTSCAVLLMTVESSQVRLSW